MTYLNEFTRMPSNNPPERVYMGAHTIEMKAQEKVRQTSYTNVHNAHTRSQLSIFDTGSCA